MIAVFSTAYLAPIQYYIEYTNSIKPNLELFEHYNKQTYRNRCSIMGANKKLNLIIPIKKSRIQQNQLITNVEINNNENWQALHWKSLQASYRSSPYFEYYEDDFHILYHKKYIKLIDINNDFHALICKLLSINEKFTYTKKFIKNYKIDFRYSICPKKCRSLKNYKKYIQVFSSKIGFFSNLSIIDLLFNLGPEARIYLNENI